MDLLTRRTPTYGSNDSLLEHTHINAGIANNIQAKHVYDHSHKKQSVSYDYDMTNT